MVSLLSDLFGDDERREEKLNEVKAIDESDRQSRAFFILDSNN